MKILIFGRDGPLTAALARSLRERRYRVVAESEAERVAQTLDDEGIEILVHAAADGLTGPRRCRGTGDLLRCAVSWGVRQVVLLSSAAVNEPNWRSLGMLPESRLAPRRTNNRIPRSWLRFEAEARDGAGEARLAILRPTAMPMPGGEDFFSRLLRGAVALTPPGFDPPLQLLSVDDLAAAVACVVAHQARGVYNVAPASPITLHRALRLAGVRRLPVPRLLQRCGGDQLDYIRYPWTVSDEKIRSELGFQPSFASADALLALRPPRAPRRPADTSEPAEFDPWGLDHGYTAALGKTFFRLLHDRYWRIEHEGMKHVPATGRAVLAGVHRGFQPWDAVMAVHLLTRELGRHPRFLIHPTLVKFPFLAPHMQKLGGLHACRENAAYVLERDELLGIYPEGISGAFRHYRDVYELGRFRRDEFVKIALRHRAPIVPFVNVGSAEIFPILARFDWAWWKRYSEWPCFPITPTMGLLPLPSKWHTRFLEPIHVEERYGPEAADDPAVVRGLSQQVRGRMEEAIAEMLARRKSVFWGSIFEDASHGRGDLERDPRRMKEQVA